MLSCNTGNYLIKRQSERYIIIEIKPIKSFELLTARHALVH